MHVFSKLKAWPVFTWNSDILAPLLSALRFEQGLWLGTMLALDEKTQKEAQLYTLLKDTQASCQQAQLQASENTLLKHIYVEEILQPLRNFFYLYPPKAQKKAQEKINTEQQRQHCGILELRFAALEDKAEVLTGAWLLEKYSKIAPNSLLFRRDDMATVYDKKSGKKLSATTPGWRVNELDTTVNKSLFNLSLKNKSEPVSEDIQNEILTFLAWYNYDSLPAKATLNKSKSPLWDDSIIQAGIVHFWLNVLTPFAWGSKIFTSLLTDMALLRADNCKKFYSLSTILQGDLKNYQSALEACNQKDLDITPWLKYFLEQLHYALKMAKHDLIPLLKKAEFRKKSAHARLNPRQQKSCEFLLQNHVKSINSSTHSKINDCSGDTALRDLQELVNLQLLKKNPAGGRSTSYSLDLRL